MSDGQGNPLPSSERSRPAGGSGGRGRQSQGQHDGRSPRDRGGKPQRDAGLARNARPVQYGTIANLKEGFGFIQPMHMSGESIGEPLGDHVFFHFSSLASRDPPRRGDEVSFESDIDQRTGRQAARKVDVVPQGTIPRPPPPQEVEAKAAIEREPRGRNAEGAHAHRLLSCGSNLMSVIIS
eukprot:4690082-Pleurochrysis_carterae.AAC.2